MTSIAVDLGGTRMKTALVRDGRVMDSAITPIDSNAGLRKQLYIIEPEISRLLSVAPVQHLGIAFPGIVDPLQKRVLSANGKYLDALDFDWAGWAKERFGIGLVMDNDANAALLGETAFGCAADCKNAVIMILGTGIGSAALMEGKLLRGRHFQAGCLGGHFSIRGIADGLACNCGSMGCAETIGSGWAMAKAVQAHASFRDSGLSTEPCIDFRALEKWDASGDSLAMSTMNSCIDAWSSCALNLIHAYDPEILILSGGVIHCGRRIVEPITAAVQSYAWTPWGTVDIRVSKQPEHSVLLGLHKLSSQHE